MGHFPMLEKRGDHVVRNAVHCFLSVYPWASLWGCKTRKEIGWWPVWWLCWSMGGGTVPFRQDDLLLITLRLCLQQAVAESCSPVQVLAVVAQLLSVSTLQRHGLKHARLPCPSLSTWVCSNSCPLSWWCHPTISSSVAPFSSCPQPFPASGSFLGLDHFLCFFRSQNHFFHGWPTRQTYLNAEMRVDSPLTEHPQFIMI